MKAHDPLAAFGHCAAVDCQSLGDFLGPLLNEDLETLANLPGTPGQVMSAQFTFYVKSSVILTDALYLEKDVSSRLMDMVLRLPPASKRKNPRTGITTKEDST